MVWLRRFSIVLAGWIVNHWANFGGKAMYYLERIILVETELGFRNAYDVSTKRRKLSLQSLIDINTERNRGDHPGNGSGLLKNLMKLRNLSFSYSGVIVS